MRNPRQKRGEKNRDLDPILGRAISRLREHMREQGLSQSDVARASGIDQGRISRVLSELLPEVSFYVFARIVRAAGLSLDGVVAELPQLRETPVSRTSSKPPQSETA